MPELLVPELVENPFRELYRELIVSSILRSVEQQEARYRDSRRRRRASRYKQAAAELGQSVARAPTRPDVAPEVVPAAVVEKAQAPAITPVPVRLDPPAPTAVEAEPPVPAAAVQPVVVSYEPWFGTGVRRLAAGVWVLVLVALVANVIVLGFDSWGTGAADLTLMIVTLAWFATAVADPGLPDRS
jgi:hypothetical protein